MDMWVGGTRKGFISSSGPKFYEFDKIKIFSLGGKISGVCKKISSMEKILSKE